MTQTLTTERLREIAERRSPSLRWGEAEKIAAELLASREAQPVGVPEYLTYLKDPIISNVLADDDNSPMANAARILAREVKFWRSQPLFTAPPAPAVLPVQHYEELCRQHPDMSIGDAIIRAAWWNHCRAELLAAVPEYDILEDYRAEMLKRVTFGGDGKSSCNANSPEIPEGWKLVPIDATRAMIDAAQRVEEDGYDAMHKAMIAAAPEGGN